MRAREPPPELLLSIGAPTIQRLSQQLFPQVYPTARNLDIFQPNEDSHVRKQNIQTLFLKMTALLL